MSNPHNSKYVGSSNIIIVPTVSFCEPPPPKKQKLDANQEPRGQTIPVVPIANTSSVPFVPMENNNSVPIFAGENVPNNKPVQVTQCINITEDTRRECEQRIMKTLSWASNYLQSIGQSQSKVTQLTNSTVQKKYAKVDEEITSKNVSKTTFKYDDVVKPTKNLPSLSNVARTTTPLKYNSVATGNNNHEIKQPIEMKFSYHERSTDLDNDKVKALHTKNKLNSSNTAEKTKTPLRLKFPTSYSKTHEKHNPYEEKYDGNSRLKNVERNNAVKKVNCISISQSKIRENITYNKEKHDKDIPKNTKSMREAISVQKRSADRNADRKKDSKESKPSTSKNENPYKWYGPHIKNAMETSNRTENRSEKRAHTYRNSRSPSRSRSELRKEKDKYSSSDYTVKRDRNYDNSKEKTNPTKKPNNEEHITANTKPLTKSNQKYINKTSEMSNTAVKSVVQVKNNYDLNSPKIVSFHSNNVEDLRSKLKRKHENNKRENLIITVPNNEKKDTTPKPVIPEESPKLQKKSRKYKKIKLVINVICENGSESSESDNETNNKDSQEVNEDIISFLDDFNVDDIVDSLNDEENKVNVKNPLKEECLEDTEHDTVKESIINEQELKAKDDLNMHKRFYTKSPQVKLELELNRNSQEIEDYVNDKKYRSLELTKDENQTSNKIHDSGTFQNKNKVGLIEIKSRISDTNSTMYTRSFKCGQNVADRNVTVPDIIVKEQHACSTQIGSDETKHNINSITKPVSTSNKETNLTKNEKSWAKLDSSPTEAIIRSIETGNNTTKQDASETIIDINSTNIVNNYKLDNCSANQNTNQTKINYYPTKLDADRIKQDTDSTKLIPIHTQLNSNPVKFDNNSNKLDTSQNKQDNYLTKQSTDINTLGSSQNNNLSNVPGRHNIFSAIDAIVSSNQTKLGSSQSKVDKNVTEIDTSINILDSFSTKVATKQSKEDSKSTELIPPSEQGTGLNKLNSDLNLTKIDYPKSKLDNNRTKPVSNSTEAGNDLITTNVVLDSIATQINIIKNTQVISSKEGAQPNEQDTSKTEVEYGANKVDTNSNELTTSSTKLGSNQLDSNLTELDIITNKLDTCTSPNNLATDSTELNKDIDINKYDITPNKLSTSQTELNTILNILKIDPTEVSTIPINKTTSEVANITTISDKGKTFENETKEVVTIDLTVVESENEPNNTSSSNHIVQTPLTQPESEKQHTIAKSASDDVIDLTLSPKSSEIKNVERPTKETSVPMHKDEEKSSNHKNTKSCEDTSEMINNAENLSIDIEMISKEHENKETIADENSININDVISIEEGSEMSNKNSLINTGIVCKEHENNETIAMENSIDVDLSTETEEVSNNIIPTKEQPIESNQKLVKTEETLTTKYSPELQHQEECNNSQNNIEISNITYEKESTGNNITKQTTEVSQDLQVHEVNEKLEKNDIILTALHLACEQVNSIADKTSNNSGTKGTDLNVNENDVVSLNDENLTSYNSETSDADKTPSAGSPECVKLKMITNKNDAPVKLMEVVPEVKTTLIKQDMVHNEKNKSESSKQPQTAVTKLYLRGTELLKALEFRLTKNFKTKITIESLIHHGRFSKVYRCKAENGRNYALKVLNKGKRMTGCPIGQMLKTIQADIPKKNYHIIFLVDGFTMAEHSCYVMDFFPKNIKEVMNERKKCFHIDVVQMLTRQLVSAVLILRNHNILHLDIKPAHILINANNDRVKLAGFDQAQYLEGHTVLPGVGTANYRAPEAILGFPYFGKVDVWSTALVIYEMCTNSQLFPGQYNNDILYKQMCILGNIPNDMLVQCVFTNKHYRGQFFARRYGPAWEQCELIARFRKSNRISSSLFEAYYRDWGQKLTRRQRSDDSAKLRILRDLLQEMLHLNPTTRMPIEFVYTNAFIYETFNLDVY